VSEWNLEGRALFFFATDLTNVLACRHLIGLERLIARGLATRAFFDDLMLEILRDDLVHERAGE
jgi:hypothetical protein